MNDYGRLLVSKEKALAIALVLTGGVLGVLAGTFESSFGEGLDRYRVWWEVVAIGTWLAGLGTLTYSGLTKATSRLYVTYLFVFGLFHYGIPLGLFLGGGTEYLLQYQDRWYYGPHTPLALGIAHVFLLGYLSAQVLPGFSRPNGVPSSRTEPRGSSYLVAILVLSICLWIVAVKFVAGVADYPGYQQAQASWVGTVCTYGNVIIAVSFIALSLDVQRRKIALIAYALWALLALPIGLRGEVLFPLAIAVPLLVKQGSLRMTKLRLILIVVSILAISSAVFGFRATGNINGAVSANPLNAVSEMGGSLRPVYEVVRWLENGTYELYLGATYFAPLERAVGSVVPIFEVLPAREDHRLMNVAIAENAGPYGFSVAAEAYINFGLFGAFLVGATVGLLLLRVDRGMIYGARRFALLHIAAVFAIYFHIRQSFVGAFGALVVGATILWVVDVLSRVRSEKQH